MYLLATLGTSGLSDGDSDKNDRLKWGIAEPFRQWNNILIASVATNFMLVHRDSGGFVSTCSLLKGGVQVQAYGDRGRMKRKNYCAQNLGFNTPSVGADAKPAGGVQVHGLYHEGEPEYQRLFNYTNTKALIIFSLK